MVTTNVPGPINTARIVPRGIPQAGVNAVQLPDGSSIPVNQYQCLKVSLDNIFPDTSYVIQGTNFWAVYSSGSTALCFVKFNLQTNDAVPVYAPMHLDGFPFSQVFISNPTAQAGQFIYLFACLDNQKYKETEVG